MSTIQTTKSDAPSSQNYNYITLNSKTDGKITHVNIYASGAHLTQEFKFRVNAGQNHVVISGLPMIFDHNAMRVECSTEVVVQDITISNGVPATAYETPKIQALTDEIQAKNIMINRKEKTVDALVASLSSMNVGTNKSINIRDIVHNIDEVSSDCDESLVSLKKDIRKLQADLDEEKIAVAGRAVTISVSSQCQEEVVFTLHYVVQICEWTPVYDIRMDTESKDNKIKISYKASISQNTRADWTNVRLILETSQPQRHAYPPRLSPWKLSFVETEKEEKVRIWSMKANTYQMESAAVNFDINDPNAIAKFEVPGLKTILGNGADHNVNVAELEFVGEMKWVCIPTLNDLRVYRTALVLNESHYPLLKGSATVFINNSFIARSEIPYVNPQEYFNLALGVDPTIRVIYHPQIKKRSQSGFYTKSNVNIFEQRITVVNNKPCAVDNIKVIDHIPTSEESTISVKLLSPALPVSSGKGVVDVNDVIGLVDMSESVEVSKGVFAQWGRGDEMDNDDLGEDGAISWIYRIPAQGRVNLLLSWEVSAPADKVVSGL